MNPEELQAYREMLARTAYDQGVDFFGVADLTSVQGYVCRQGGDYLKSFPRAISIGIRLLDPVIDELYRHEEPAVIFTYHSHYNTVNARLDQAALILAKKIQKDGYKTYPIPASQTINPEKLEGVISHKLVAHLSGLGWIGKSCLLITPEYGPRVRFATIMTDAPLKNGSPIPNRCGTCRKCVDICPVKAFTEVPFDPSDPREARFRAILCKEYMDIRKERVGEGLCGLCVYVCPFGARRC